MPQKRDGKLQRKSTSSPVDSKVNQSGSQREPMKKEVPFADVVAQRQEHQNLAHPDNRRRSRA